MKKMKKFVSVLVASAMVMAMAAPTFAVEGEDTPTAPNVSVENGVAKEGTITIDNPQKAKDENGEETADPATYKAYRIFDVTYSGSNYAYSIDVASPWVSVLMNPVATGEGDLEINRIESNIEGLSFTKAAGADVFYVTVEDGFSAPALAELLQSSMSGIAEGLTGNYASEDFVAAGTDVVASDLPLGYYFVTTNSGSLCNLTTTNPDVTIHDKNEQPVIEKKAVTVDEDGNPTKEDLNPSVEIGDTIGYEIKGSVPNLVGYENYTYKVSDTMSPGLTLLTDPRISVSIGGNTITVPREGLVFDEHSFTLTLDLKDYEDAIEFGDDIVITYAALVNESAANGINPETNAATLEYSNNPGTDETGETPEPSVVDLYTSNLVIDKYRADDETAKLEGASFVLQNADGLYYQYTEATETTDAKVDWVANRDDIVGDDGNVTTPGATVVTTDEKGAASFICLKDGTYYLVETEAPTGYNLLKDRVEVQVEGSKTEETGVDGDGASFAVVGYALTKIQGVGNNAGTILPGTGGIGTTIFYAAGIILMAGAVFFVVRRRRA